MKKQTLIKIISRTIIFTFAIFFIQAVLPLQASAASAPLNYENPNKSGNNPYKFKTSDALNSELIMQVVGCTGVVDKVSTAVTNFATEVLTKAARAKVKTAVCAIGKKLGVASVASTPQVSIVEIPKLINCSEIQQTNDQIQNDTSLEQQKKDEATKRREECLNGIAVTLAKNQLTAMTRYTMNWVNTGFNGDPMYVRNITAFNNSLERNVLETGISILTSPDKAYPYGYAFRDSAINGYKTGSSFRSGASNFLGSLTSDLSNFITDPRSYYSETALEKANGTNDTFANDFSTGGWSGWLALTQRDQNNPLGFALQTSQYVADQQAAQMLGVRDELQTNNGFLSQKKCVLWDVYASSGENIGQPLYDRHGNIQTSPTKRSAYDKCDINGYEVITPGSLIKDKVSTYINSGERQLELVKTINDSLNSLFASLITKFQNEGLSSLSSDNTDFGNLGGYGDNSIYGNDSILVSDVGLGGSSSSNSLTTSAYTNGSFDLTRDLGNTFIHASNTRLGTWNAKNNITNDKNNPTLGIDLAPVHCDTGDQEVEKNGCVPYVNAYYIVSVAGNTKLFNNGYNGWDVGDRAYWNGSEWQNWKKDTVSPIKKRGVIQIQKDYQVAAKEILKFLPNVMPKIGELDYCIPGPNPNWRIGAGEAESTFTELTSTLKKKNIASWSCPGGSREVGGNCYSVAGTILGGLLGDPIPNSVPHVPSLTVAYSFASPGEPEYDNYFNIFKDTTSSLWSEIKTSSYWKMFNNTQYYGGEDNAQSIIDAAVKKVSSDMTVFYNQYGNYIDNLYSSKGLMQREFIEKENTSDLIPNPSYLPMAAEGLDITKDIISYNDEITKATSGYEDSINKASANINKLTAIKDAVGKIIKAAQDRRDAHLIEILQGTKYAGMSEPVARRTYFETYRACFDEENVSYDDYSLIKDAGGDKEVRCTDDIDNDLDGLVDSLDPDCAGLNIENSVGNGRCINGATSSDSQNFETNLCATNLSSSECQRRPYYHAGVKTLCVWTTN